MGKSSTSFKKGQPRLPNAGSKKGQKYSGVEVKHRILNCIGDMPIEDMLVQLYDENKNKFWDVLTKMLPNNVELTGGEDENRPLRLIIKGYSDRNDRHNTSDSSST